MHRVPARLDDVCHLSDCGRRPTKMRLANPCTVDGYSDWSAVMRDTFAVAVASEYFEFLPPRDQDPTR